MRKLADIDANVQTMREGGVKCILRLFCGDSDNGKTRSCPCGPPPCWVSRAA